MIKATLLLALAAVAATFVYNREVFVAAYLTAIDDTRCGATAPVGAAQTTPSILPTASLPTVPLPAATRPTATLPAELANAVEAAPEPVVLGEEELLRGVPGEGPLSEEDLRGWLADERNHRPLRFGLPTGLDAGAGDLASREAPRVTRAKIELGRQLYFDPRLSVDGTVSCASCHDPDHGYAASTRFGVGVRGQTGRRNSPTVMNRVLSGLQFLDGRAESLEEQAIGPIANPVEMGFTHDLAVKKIASVDGYRVQFEAIFPGPTPLKIENLGAAIAAFERALVTGPSPWDLAERLAAFLEAYSEDLEYGDPELLAEQTRLTEASERSPLSNAARRGAELFYGDRTGCTLCHAGANFSDESYHNLGVGLAGVTDPSDDSIDWGRYAVNGEEADRGAFKTPTLRNVAQTAPYLHDGSLGTLAEVVAFYVEGGRDNPWLSDRIQPLNLNEQEQADLVAFLEALTGPLPEVERGRLPE